MTRHLHNRRRPDRQHSPEGVFWVNIAGEQVARMYQAPGLTWLERQAEVAEKLVAERKRT